MSPNPDMGKIYIGNNPGVWSTFALSDLIWVTLGQDTYCAVLVQRQHSALVEQTHIAAVQKHAIVLVLEQVW